MTEATNRDNEQTPPVGSHNRAVVAVSVPNTDAGDVLTTILRAQQHGHHVFVYCDTLDAELATFCRRLDATPIERDHSVTLDDQLRTDAREHGFPGAIYHDSPDERLDFETSSATLDQSAEYTVDAAVEYDDEQTVLIGIPTYNEEVGIGSVVLAAQACASEVIVVDDGSTDNTVELASDAGATVVEHADNQGKGAAIQTLFETVRDREFDAFVVLDGDGQHDPDEIPAVARPVLDGEADLVIGSRYLDGDDDETPAYRRLGQRVLDLLTLGPSKTRVTDSQSGFRALSPRAVEELAVTTDNFGVETEMIDLAARKDLQIAERSIDARYEGIDGQTQNPLRHGLTVVAFVLQLVRDKHPLAFFGLPGLLCVLFGGLYGLQGYLIYQSSGVFLPVKALGSGFVIVLGMLFLFTGLILNSVSIMFQQME